MSGILERLTIPAGVVLVTFLALSSQYAFTQLDPGPLSRAQQLRFNTLVACLLICYARGCLTNPGSLKRVSVAQSEEWSRTQTDRKVRICRKCNEVKPDRWHHCKTCGVCIPKMDHHCIWLNNCVSHCTFPHFIRFLLYGVTAMCYLQYFIFVRLKVLWDNRNLPHVRC